MNSREEEVKKRRARSSAGGGKRGKIRRRLIPLLAIIFLFLAIWAWQGLSLIQFAGIIGAMLLILLFFKFQMSKKGEEPEAEGKEGEIKAAEEKEILLTPGEEWVDPREEPQAGEEATKSIPGAFHEDGKVIDLPGKKPGGENMAEDLPALPAKENTVDVREILMELEERMAGIQETLSRLEERMAAIQEILLKEEDKVDLQKVFSQWDQKAEKTV